MAMKLIPQSNATTPADLPDVELLRRVRAGDEDAFLALYRRLQGGIYRFALRMSGSSSVAEDVTQETFMILLQGGNAYDQFQGSLSGYLFGIARNQTLRRFEKDRGVLQLVPVEETSETSTPEPLIVFDDPLETLTRQETIESVRQLVLALPVHYREVVVLCDLHEMSYQEVSDILGCALGTVRSRLHRGRGLLLERLRGTELEPAQDIDPMRCIV